MPVHLGKLYMAVQALLILKDWDEMDTESDFTKRRIKLAVENVSTKK